MGIYFVKLTANISKEKEALTIHNFTVLLCLKVALLPQRYKRMQLG